MASTDISADESKIIAFPNNQSAERENGVFLVEYIEISQDQSEETLANLCRRFGLPDTGNKDILIERLRIFSALGSSEWSNALLPGAQQSQMSPQKPSNPQETKSQRNTACEDPIVGGTSALYNGPTVPQYGTQDQDSAFAWAAKINEKYPYEPYEERMKGVKNIGPDCMCGAPGEHLC